MCEDQSRAILIGPHERGTYGLNRHDHHQHSPSRTKIAHMYSVLSKQFNAVLSGMQSGCAARVIEGGITYCCNFGELAPLSWPFWPSSLGWTRESNFRTSWSSSQTEMMHRLRAEHINLMYVNYYYPQPPPVGGALWPRRDGQQLWQVFFFFFAFRLAFSF